MSRHGVGARCRIRVPAALALGAVLPAAAQEGQNGAAIKTLRVAFQAAETGFDPARIHDSYSLIVAAHIFERLVGYDPLARPVRLLPVTAAALPEPSAGYRRWTVRLQPGILFADDAAFGGRPRELVAADYVYSIKRFADPTTNSSFWSSVEQAGFSGLADVRRRAIETQRPFDYDAVVPGLQASERYTLVLTLDAPRPRLPYTLAGSTLGAVAREVVEHYGERIAEHPVGTGPFRLAAWRRSSLIVLERNPRYRKRLYDAQPAADDMRGRADAGRLAGRRLPLVDRVEIAVIEEDQPRWLAFLQGGLDMLEVPGGYADLALPNGKVAPYLAARGVHGRRELDTVSSLTMFNLDDAVVGGYAPERVALRRAIALAIDVPREIRLTLSGQGVVAHSPIQPHTSGFEPAFRSEMGEYDPARAKALLDTFGYIDRDGDGWRERPDGSRLEVVLGTQPEQRSRRLDELMKRDFDAIGVRLRFAVAKWPEQLKAVRAGRVSMWSYGLGAASPDGITGLARYHGAAVGSTLNLARFKLPAFDAVYARLLELPDGPERRALFDEAKRLAVAYMAYKIRLHRVTSDVVQPWLLGYRRHPFALDWYQWVDIEPAATR